METNTVKSELSLYTVIRPTAWQNAFVKAAGELREKRPDLNDPSRRKEAERVVAWKRYTRMKWALDE